MNGAVNGEHTEPPRHDGVSWQRIAIGTCFVVIVPLFGLFAARGPVDGTGDAGAGFWGAKTANVNWCESDYVVTHYIAEFGNAISSCSIIVLGVYGLVMHWTTVEMRFIIAFACLLVVGAGSFAFHATLWRSLQLWDELPMVWTEGVFLYIIIAMEDKREVGPRRALGVSISLLVTFATVFIALFDTEGHAIFCFIYGGTEVLIIFLAAHLTFKHRSRVAVYLFETSLLFNAASFLLWLVDRNFCPVVRSLQLHAYWHVGTGIGVSSLVVSWIWMRHNWLGEKPLLRGTTPATFWVEVSGKAV
eukprot:TRINITY_DN7518_c0_g1_i2.p1 TRINITY_DN7518_c0_g1~~TRINITY_DN7518_c0_g1_i2.p1  ORF type:complete len:303 (-),score=44.48 TRINITY_DN7518_c0_g1_i2:81-989(-)